MYLGGHQIACVAGIKKRRRGEKHDPQSLFSSPLPPTPFNIYYTLRIEKEGGCVTFGQGGEEKWNPPPFFLPPNPPPLSMPAMHATHET